MNKDEILTKNRQLGKDEGLENAKFKGNDLGEKILSVAGLSIAIFSIFIGQFATAWAIGALAFAFALGQSIKIYSFTKRKYHLAWIVFSAISIIGFIAQFLAASLGWWETWGWLPTLLAR